MEDVIELIAINGECIETYPCIHEVTVKMNNGGTRTVEMDGTEIYNLYRQLKMNVPLHFREYLNFSLPK